MASGDGMVSSTPGSEALNWTHGGQVNWYSLIREDWSWLSPPRKAKTPELDTGRISTPPTGAGVRRAVIPLGRPNRGRNETPALRRPGRFTNTAVPKFDGTVLLAAAHTGF